MNGQADTERILDAYLAPEADRLPDRVIDAALADIARTPQRRALRVPWRFPPCLLSTRATGIAAVALVAVVGAGGTHLPQLDRTQRRRVARRHPSGDTGADDRTDPASPRASRTRVSPGGSRTPPRSMASPWATRRTGP